MKHTEEMLVQAFDLDTLLNCTEMKAITKAIEETLMTAERHRENLSALPILSFHASVIAHLYITSGIIIDKGFKDAQINIEMKAKFAAMIEHFKMLLKKEIQGLANKH
jgi:hypothetical protein